MKYSYDLSHQATKDLENIFDFTVEEFGLKQAQTYVTSFEMTFKKMELNPEVGRTRNEIRPELRSFIHQSHIIFYRLNSNRIKIVRILHGSRDLPKHF